MSRPVHKIRLGPPLWPVPVHRPELDLRGEPDDLAAGFEQLHVPQLPESDSGFEPSLQLLGRNEGESERQE